MVNGTEQDRTTTSKDQVSSDVVTSKEELESKPARNARLWGTALAAIGVLVLIGVVATLTFLAIAALMRGDWLTLVICVVAVILLLLLLGRLVRVAANQNKNPLG